MVGAGSVERFAGGAAVEHVPWELVVQPLGDVMLHGSDVAVEAPAVDMTGPLGMLDLLSQGNRDSGLLAEKLGITVAEATPGRIRTEIGRIIDHYKANTIAQAFCLAVEAGDIFIRPPKKCIDLRLFSPPARTLMDGIAAGLTNDELAAALQTDEQTMRDNHGMTLQETLDSGRPFLEMMRRTYELGARRISRNSQLPTQSQHVMVFSLPKGINRKVALALTDEQKRIINGRFRGKTNADLEDELGVSQRVIKTHLEQVAITLGGGLLSGIIAKAFVLGIIDFKPDTTAIDMLTEREIDVFAQVALGKSNPEIASEFFVTTGTVKTHMRRGLSKLCVADRDSAVGQLFVREIFVVGGPGLQRGSRQVG